MFVAAFAGGDMRKLDNVLIMCLDGAQTSVTAANIDPPKNEEVDT